MDARCVIGARWYPAVTGHAQCLDEKHAVLRKQRLVCPSQQLQRIRLISRERQSTRNLRPCQVPRTYSRPMHFVVYEPLPQFIRTLHFNVAVSLAARRPSPSSESARMSGALRGCRSCDETPCHMPVSHMIHPCTGVSGIVCYDCQLS